jgi:hypothetical protein
MSSQGMALRQRGTNWHTRQRQRLMVSHTARVTVYTLLIGVWLAVVIFTITRHEYWRDEVRPWSIARAAHSPLDLIHRMRYEGHPVLWYLLLYLGKLVVDTPLVLPITSIAVAALAVTLLMFRSPFPLWVKALFLFSGLPLYEYSVMARNYGISMLLLFLTACLYRYRKRYWLLLSIVLALLANTNVHSTVLTCLLAAVWVWDELRARRLAREPLAGWRLQAAVAIVGAGIALSVLVVRPPPDTILTGFYSTTLDGWASAFRDAVLHPVDGFGELVPPYVPARVGSLVLYLAVFGLVRRPALFLAALGGLVAIGVLFRVAYGGTYRHEGVYMCFLLSLYWIAIEAAPRGATQRGWKLGRKWLIDASMYGALLLLLLGGVYHDRTIRTDIDSQMSSGKAFGEYLSASREYHHAILVPEPDYTIEPVPYYAGNAIYFPREHRFGTTVSWSTAAAVDLSLGDILSLARRLKAQYGRPVLVAFGHAKIADAPTGDIRYSYNKHFTWNAAEHADFDRSLTPVAAFLSGLNDERYWVYAVK